MMTEIQLKNMTLKMLEEHLVHLKRAREQAATELARSGLDRDIEATEQEIGCRPPPPPTGLEAFTREQILDRFISLAQAEDVPDDEDDYSEAINVFYGKLDDVRREFERRDGNPGALVALYTHRDIRVRHHAADHTQTFAPALARSRLLAIDDDDWTVPQNFDGPTPVPPKVARLTTEALVQRFLDIALEQDRALERGQIPKFNRLYGQLDAVELALMARDGDQRRALLPFLDHPSAEVRLRAAYAVQDFAPVDAIRAFRTISNRDEYPQAADARGALTKLGIDWYKERWD